MGWPTSLTLEDEGRLDLSLPQAVCEYEVFHVSMLRKYTPNSAHVVDWGGIIVDTDWTFEEGPTRILDSRDHVL